MAEELENQRERVAQTFGDAMANGVMAAFDGKLSDFIRNSLRRAAFEGLSNAFANIFRGAAGGGGGGIFSAIASIFTGGLGGGAGAAAGAAGGGFTVGGGFRANITGRATGGPASGLTLVGEQGPELVALGGMANVMTANMTRAAMQSQTRQTGGKMEAVVNSVLNIDARGAAEGVEERIRAVLAVEGPRLQRQTVEATIGVLGRINTNRMPS
jgi:hypothetical protein